MAHSLPAKLFSYGLLLVAAFPLWASSAAPLTGTPAAQLYFEPNEGQVDGEVRYLTRMPGYQFFLARHEAVWRLHGRWPDRPGRPATDVVFRLHLPDAERIEARQRLPNVSHYYLGNDPRRWRRSLPAYREVVYQNLYPGIDLIFYGRGGLLEYDFRLAPGADPGAIALDFSGAEQMTVDADGNLVLQHGQTRLLQHRPVAYQMVGGEKKDIRVDYALAHDRVTFRIAAYDSALPLVIDPSVTFATYLGGSGTDEAYGVVSDDAGNLFVAGRTTSLDFPAATGGLSSGADAFVSKFDVNGNLVFTTYLGSGAAATGGRGDIARAITVDAQGRVYVTGDAEFTDFPLLNALDTSFQFPTEAFVTVLNGDGTLVYSTFYGGNGADEGHDIAVDAQGAVYITGLTTSDASLPLQNAYAASAPKGIAKDNAFIAKIDPSLGGIAGLRYGSYFGGAAVDAGLALALQGVDQVYIGGATNSSGLSKGAVYQGSWVGNDGFIAHFDTGLAGAASLRAATYLHGTEEGPVVSVEGLAVDGSGQVYATGTTHTGTFPLSNDALDSVFLGNSEAFVAILSADLGQLRYATFLGGSGEDSAAAIAMDDSGQLYVTGTTTSADFPGSGVNAAEFPYGGAREGFVLALDAARTLRYGLYLGGSGDDDGRGIAVDGSGNVHIVGSTTSVDFLPLVAAAFAAPQGGDAFVVRIAPDPVTGGGGSAGSGGGINISDGSTASSGGGGGGGGGGALVWLVWALLPWRTRLRGGAESR